VRQTDQHVEAVALELVVDKAGAVHRLDDRQHPGIVGEQPLRRAAQPVGVTWRGAPLDELTIGLAGVEANPLAAEVKTGIQHAWASLVDPMRGQAQPATGEARLHDIQSLAMARAFPTASRGWSRRLRT
jgi:hypothetical protein